ncbi:IPT/TIG domain-containing protein [Rosettibacter firmus]|uniref:IPT/TIG domain-containing protein n=1 Tax=Rosettibacter firmus TaxID=3111522 RepID=UPI00336BE341
MKGRKFVIFIVVITIAGLIKCTKYEEPPLIFNPESLQLAPSPKVSSIIPKDSARAGVREIIINGENFGVTPDNNTIVFVGGKITEIKSLSPNQIVIYRPQLELSKYNKPLDVVISVQKALELAKIKNYKINIPYEQYGDFNNYTYNLFAIEVDKQENLYIATRRALLKYDGKEIVRVGGQLPSDFSRVSDLKFGPGGFLYALVSKNVLYRLDPNTGAEEKYLTLPKECDRLDFDQYNNLYTAKKDGLFIVKPDKSIITTNLYQSVIITDIRVFNNYLYVTSAENIWKHRILDNNGTLGDQEPVLNVKNQGADFSRATISSITFDKDGMMLVVLKNHPNYSLFVLESDGTLSPYYKANILPKFIDQIVWGNSFYLYLNRGITLTRDSVRVYRMGMVNTSAPYYGRDNL